MTTNKVTIGFLKMLSDGILKIKMLYDDINDDYMPTYNELINGKYFNVFSDNVNPSHIIIGFNINKKYDDIESHVDINDIEIIYPKLENIRINEQYISILPCGGDFNISTTAIFKIIARNNDGERLIDTKYGNVSPLFKTSNNHFIISSNIVTADANKHCSNTEEGVITASYYYSGCTCSHSIKAIQEPNKESDWIFDYDVTESILLEATPQILHSNGGETTLNVYRTYTKYYFKEDSCGNRLDTMHTKGHTDNVTDKCRFENTNTNYFKRNGNVITVAKQGFGDLERSSIVTATYMNNMASTTIIQEKGSEVTYQYDLKFYESNENVMIKKLDKSTETKFVIPILLEKKAYIDNVYHSSVFLNDIKFDRYDSWFEVEYECTNNDYINVIVNVTSQNKDKNNERIGELFIRSVDNPKEVLGVTIIQPSCDVIETKWELLISGEGKYTNDTIKVARIALKPLKTKVYADHTIDGIITLDEGMNIECVYSSDMPSVLDGNVLKKTDFNGSCMMIPKHDTSMQISDAHLQVKGFIKDICGNVIAESKEIMLVLEGNANTSYTYELTFDDNSTYKEISWEYDETDKYNVKINSIRNTYINGIKTNSETYPITIKANDGIGGDFSLRNINDEYVSCRPLDKNNMNEDNVGIYNIIQKDSNNIITLDLKQDKKIETNEVEIIIKVSKEHIDNDIWLNDGAILDVIDTDGDIIKHAILPCGWLYPNMENNYDIIYKGIMKTIVGERYTFSIDNMTNGNIYINGNKMNDIIVDKTIEENTKTVEIDIKLD